MSWKDLGELSNMPGIPEPSYREINDSLSKLSARKGEVAPAKTGLGRTYYLSTAAYTAHEWLFGDPAKFGRQLSEAKQFAMGWTDYKDVFTKARPLRDTYASTLTSVEAANKAFWPTIAQYGTPYNLLMLRRVTDARFDEYREPLGNPALGGNPSLVEAFTPVQREGRLYELDFSMFESLGAWHYGIDMHKPPRFNPATLTLLERTGKGVFEPKWIRVSSSHGQKHAQNYHHDFIYQTEGSWLYALQAVKSSVTLYGIWLGHVYHWHMVTAAMQGTWYETFSGSTGHAVWKLLAPHLDYLTAFDYILLDGSAFVSFDDIAPPSRIADAKSFLELTDMFAKGRNFFDDDPANECAANGLTSGDFTEKEPWDMYPVAQNLFRIWDICAKFVDAVVVNSYADDQAVAADTLLQDWMAKAADPRRGNIRGLPALHSRASLTRVLTSLVYRITAHGYARLVSTANPALTFVANFPPCLQNEDIPYNSQELTQFDLLGYLPNTTTIGEQLDFYFAFSFSKPYVPLIPARGPETELYFDGGISDARNRALVQFRKEMTAFMGEANIDQWPRNIET